MLVSVSRLVEILLTAVFCFLCFRSKGSAFSMARLVSFRLHELAAQISGFALLELEGGGILGVECKTLHASQQVHFY